MINREKRATAADLIQRLLDGKLSGDILLDDFPRDKNDRALRAIYEPPGSPNTGSFAGLTAWVL
jgi:hypothetical protein